MKIDHLLDDTVLDGRFPLPVDRPFTADMARREGVSRFNIIRLIDAGLLHRPILGAYLATQAGDSVRLRSECLALVVPEDCVVCDRHAGWVHGAEMVLAPNEHLGPMPIAIYRPSGRGRLRNALSDSGERNLTPGDLTVVGGIQVTTRIRTAWDLGRHRYRERSLAGMDQMLRLGGFDHDEFLAGVERFRGMRWVTRLRELAPLADGRAASPGESILRLRWIDSGLPRPTPQLELWVDGVLVAIFDLGLEELLLAAEYLGVEWHTSDDQIADDDRRRDLAVGQGWRMEEFWKEDLFSRARSVEEILRTAAREIRAQRRLIVDLTPSRL